MGMDLSISIQVCQSFWINNSSTFWRVVQYIQMDTVHLEQFMVCVDHKLSIWLV